MSRDGRRLRVESARLPIRLLSSDPWFKMFLLCAFGDSCHAGGVRQLHFIPMALLVLGGTCGLTGCAATSGTVKERGVYTTLATQGHHLDLPSSGYASYKNFGPSQTPAAVVVGYGSWDGVYTHPQQFDLQVIET